MRRMITASALALMAAGCALPQQSGSTYQSYQPLDAYIISPDQHLRFHVSRPAYVAMFEITPGVETRLLYPTPGQGRRNGYVYAGDRVFQGGGYWSSDLYLAGGLGSSVSRPRFLFLIASERPLEVEQFGARGYRLQRAMGHRSFVAAHPYDAMERLVDLTIPRGADDGSWTTDFYMHWPEALDRRRVGREVIVACNGYQISVPYEIAHQVRQQICGRDTSLEPGEPAEDDSTAIVQPGRRSPLPPAERQVREFVPTSRQLQRPVTSRPETRPLDGERITGAVTDEDDASAQRNGRNGGNGRNGVKPGRATPATPADPGSRGTPATPATPADPGSRGTPATPAAPADPGSRGTPATPATPAAPAERGTPASPAPPHTEGTAGAAAERASRAGRAEGGASAGRDPKAAEPAATPAPAARPAPERSSRPASRPGTATSRPASAPPSATPATTPAPAPAERPAPRSRGAEKCDPCGAS